MVISMVDIGFLILFFILSLLLLCGRQILTEKEHEFVRSGKLRIYEILDKAI